MDRVEQSHGISQAVGVILHCVLRHESDALHLLLIALVDITQRGVHQGVAVALGPDNAIIAGTSKLWSAIRKEASTAEGTRCGK